MARVLQQPVQDADVQPQDGARGLDVPHGGFDRVLFVPDLAVLLQTSVRTIERRLRAGTFPITEMPAIDHRHRWSSAVVKAWLAKPELAPALRVVRRRA